METTSSKYQAARSQGGMWLTLIGIGFFALALLILTGVVKSGSGAGAALMLPVPIAIIIGVCFFVLAGWAGAVRYELTPERITMFCGPIRYNILVAEIRSADKTDLGLTLWSSTRFPGFALGRIPYRDIGDVVMCATRSLKGIILIETANKKYGMTPADESGFLAELRGYLEAR